jgi:(1->4)-alpha-D-glucan 1-alpha-D-glucosylmutase
LSLVDPDNRRLPDYERGKTLLAQNKGELAPLMTAWHDGHIKLRVTQALLEARRAHPQLFASGGYMPLSAEGSGAHRLCAFLRQHGRLVLAVAVQLFPSLGLASQSRVSLPPAFAAYRWHEIIRDRTIRPVEDSFSAEQLFSGIPVSVLLGTAADS